MPNPKNAKAFPESLKPGQNSIKLNTEEYNLVLKVLALFPGQIFSGFREFFVFILNKFIETYKGPVEDLKLKEELKAAQEELESLKNLNETLKKREEISELNTIPADWSTFFKKFPDLEFLHAFKDPNREETVSQLLLRVFNIQEQQLIKVMMDPLILLEKEDFEELKKWVNEVMMPGIRSLTGIENLELNGPQKFMLMFDYVKADPVESILQKLKLWGVTLNEAQHEFILDQGFPRREMMNKILEQWQNANAEAEIDRAAGEYEEEE